MTPTASAVQSYYADTFERDMACTEAEWLAWLPAAIGAHRFQLEPGRAQVTLGGGALRLQWQVLAPRVIALVRLPRLQVSFRFDGVPEPQRQDFMRRFDLYTQRGGG